MVFNDGQAIFDAPTDYLEVPTAGMSPEEGPVELRVLATALDEDDEQFAFGHTTLPAFNTRLQIKATRSRMIHRLGSSADVVAQRGIALNQFMWF